MNCSCTIFGYVSDTAANPFNCSVQLWVYAIGVLLCFLIVLLTILLAVALLLCRNRPGRPPPPPGSSTTVTPATSPELDERRTQTSGFIERVTSSFRAKSPEPEYQPLVPTNKHEPYGANRQDSTDDSASVFQPVQRRPPRRRKRTPDPDQVYTVIRQDEGMSLVRPIVEGLVRLEFLIVAPNSNYTKLKRCTCRKPATHTDYEEYIAHRTREWPDDKQQGAFIVRNPLSQSENVCKVLTLYGSPTPDIEKRVWHYRVYYNSDDGMVSLGSDQTQTFDDVEDLIETGSKTNVGLPFLLKRRLVCNLVPGCYACGHGSIKRRNAAKRKASGNRDFFDQ
ncbi:uncharacterized protein [Oscarella lobularis]|uniref:uncharacterized protein isoform X2 n=1 Tax=Oscarella lobularis TaxID=121494 RepID=UPI00331386BE